MRPIQPLTLPDVVPASVHGAPPALKLVDPRRLDVDERYQRGLSDRSVRLIRKIVAEWRWDAFKPPVVVAAGERFEVIDGQHTAIAAVTHGGILEIPVLVVDAEALEQRAGAFVRHNRDRIAVTPGQLHAAMMAAGDEDAVTLDQVCARAGITVLRQPPGMGRYRPGDTMAVVSVRALINRRFPIGARRVLEVCASSGAAPVSADLIKAVECLLFSPEYKGEIDAERVGALLRGNLDALSVDAERFSAERRVPKWRGLASVIFMNRRRARHAA